MVQSFLFFLLGVLALGFVVALFAPAALRRSARLARRRLEATLPLTQAEIQAQKDGVRAEFATTARRLEMEIQALREKAAAQLVEINRGREAARKAEALREEKEKALVEAEARISALEAEAGQRESRLQQLVQSLAGAEKTVEAHAAEMEKLGRMYDEASFSSSNRQIELVARESELEKLRQDIAILRAQRKEADRGRQDALAEAGAAREALKGEQRKVAGLEKKVGQLLATLADREERLDRREHELARLRQQPNGISPVAGNGAPRAGDAAMREAMQDLAAQVVDLVIRLDGPDSPAARTLAAPAAAQPEGAPRSLAERVKALQAARAD